MLFQHSAGRGLPCDTIAVCFSGPAMRVRIRGAFDPEAGVWGRAARTCTTADHGQALQGRIRAHPGAPWRVNSDGVTSGQAGPPDPHTKRW